MTEAHGMSYPFQNTDWIQGINMDNLREGRLARLISGGTCLRYFDVLRRVQLANTILRGMR